MIRRLVGRGRLRPMGLGGRRWLMLFVVVLAVVTPPAMGATVTRGYDLAAGTDPGSHFGYHVCGEHAPLLHDDTCGPVVAMVAPEGFRAGLVGLRSPDGDAHRSATLVVADETFDSAFVLACVPPAGTGADTIRCVADSVQVTGCGAVYVALPASDAKPFGGHDRPLMGYVHTWFLDPDVLQMCFGSSGVGTAVYH